MKHPSSLSSSREFRRVLDGGHRRRAPLGTVYVLPSDPASPSRLGLIVSRRIGGAVARNRAKRRLRAAFRSAWQAPGFDVVVRADPASLHLSFQELENSLRVAS